MNSYPVGGKSFFSQWYDLLSRKEWVNPYIYYYIMHLKLECLPDMGGKVTLNVLAYGIIPFRIWETIYEKNHSVLNEIVPLPDRTGKQSSLFNSVDGLQRSPSLMHLICKFLKYKHLKLSV